MKKIIVSLFFIPFATKAGLHSSHSSTILVEARSGEWPISLQKTIDNKGASYSLMFRDEQVLTNVLLDTLPFGDLTQLKYFEKALTVLKTGNNGDVAKFKDYTIKRAESRKEGKWYILRYQWGLLNFQQAEADTLVSTIRKL